MHTRKTNKIPKSYALMQRNGFQAAMYGDAYSDNNANNGNNNQRDDVNGLAAAMGEANKRRRKDTTTQLPQRQAQDHNHMVNMLGPANRDNANLVSTTLLLIIHCAASF